jgi:hypothetical protein
MMTNLQDIGEPVGIQDQDLAIEVRRFLSSGETSISYDFAQELGCPTAILEIGGARSEKAIIPTARLALIRTYLPKVLVPISPRQDNSATISRVLGGLYEHHCWRDCLADETQAYSLASALLTFIESYTKDFELDVIVKPGVIAILNTWLAPASEWEKLPSANIAARMMFGDAWCSLFLPESTYDPLYAEELMSSPDYAAGRLVLECRPPFLAGLCVAQSVSDPVSLPDAMWERI